MFLEHGITKRKMIFPFHSNLIFTNSAQEIGSIVTTFSRDISFYTLNVSDFPEKSSSKYTLFHFQTLFLIFQF